MIDSFIIESLCDLQNLGYESKEYESSKSALLFPQKRDKTDRISEQEARVLLYDKLLKNNIHFSIETPTESEFSITGSKKLSGNLDICIYEKNNNNKFKRIHCIEYKAHNTGKIKSDMQKLLYEKGDNYFVHVLSAANNATLFNNTSESGVINKYITELKNAKNLRDICCNSLTFYICILKPFCILYKKLEKTDFDNLKDILGLEYKIENNNIEVHKNWKKIKIKNNAGNQAGVVGGV